jgi:hypothetical protein
MMRLMVLLQATPGQSPVPLPSPTASWDDPITVATVVVAVFTVVSVIVSAFMWSATREQARISREIFEAAHRPYVGVLELSGSMSIGARVDGWLSILIKNSGTVPAYQLRAFWLLSIGDVVILDTRGTEKASVLLPDEPTRLHLNYVISKEQFSELKEGANLNIVVSIKYKGVTKKEYDYTQHAIYTASNQLGYVMMDADSS